MDVAEALSTLFDCGNRSWDRADEKSPDEDSDEKFWADVTMEVTMRLAYHLGFDGEALALAVHNAYNGYPTMEFIESREQYIRTMAAYQRQKLVAANN